MTARKLDQFYTKRGVAQECIARLSDYLVDRDGDWIWIEPSAGDGAFLDYLPYPRIALDIAPQSDGVEKTDFLTWHPGALTRKAVFVGNPPFGKNASLARRFFDRAAMFGDVVAFILPRTFQKPAFIGRLHRHMHLVAEQVLSEDSFVFDNQDYAVPTVFQIWEKRPEPRPIETRRLNHSHFSFVTAERADFAFQRVGARAGLISEEGLRKSPQSHYFLKSHIAVNHLYERLRSLDWDVVKWRTAGNPSIGKGEIVAAYECSHGS